MLFVQGGGEGAHDADALLAASLERDLGGGYQVRYPRMPDEAAPEAGSWTRRISGEISRLGEEAILVGHSLGGAMLLKYLSRAKAKQRIAGLFLIAAPAWDGKSWDFDLLKLPDGIEDKLASIPRLFLYHSRDDAVVPFEHLALHKANIPKATVRAVNGRGHQFGNDLSVVARDILGRE
ncbi:MAG: alpha/beta hydrolase [Fibrobacteria bacterium]